MAKVLMKGNEAVAEAIVRAEADAFFGYPITPQSEIPEYLSREMPKHGKLFLQAESELSAVNMLYGAAATGARVVTSSSSVGIDLMLETISAMAGIRLPVVVVDMCRNGPGMGNLEAAQEDYHMHANGSYKIPILLPATVQEAVEMTYEAFDIAQLYGTPVMVLADGMIGQMMEGVDFDKLPARRDMTNAVKWRLCGKGDKGYRTRITINTVPLYKQQQILEKELYPLIAEKETRCETLGIEDADIVICAYGTASRMAKSILRDAEAELGIKIGLIRPMTAWPYPSAAFDHVNPGCKAAIVPEINIIGQMIDDVRIAVKGRYPVFHCGNTLDGMLNEDNIMESIKTVWKEVNK